MTTPNWEAQYKFLASRIDRLLNHCPHDECMECSEIICPGGEPLHLHHDGCPYCSQFKTYDEALVAAMRDQNLKGRL